MSDVHEGFSGKERVHRIVADALTNSMVKEERKTPMYEWERQALRWLAEEWLRDPSLSFCGWAGDRVREYMKREGYPPIPPVN